MKFDLYHGTNIKAADKILKEGFIESIGENYWMDRGVYFYTTPFEAIQWRKKVDGTTHPSYAILRANIEVSDDRYFNFELDGYKNALYNLLEELNFALNGEFDRKVNLILTKYNQYKFRRFIFELITKRFRPALIQARFRNNINNNIVSLIYNNGIITETEVQVCVKDLGIIKNIDIYDLSYMGDKIKELKRILNNKEEKNGQR